MCTEKSFVNKEWENFISSNYECLSSDDDDELDDYVIDCPEICSNEQPNLTEMNLETTPKCSDIYISTKTKIAYLNQPIDLKIFWKIPVISYSTPTNGVIKKQIKINSINVEELIYVQEKLQLEKYFEEHVITSINNPEGRIKFKDIRKISIGLSKKDLMSYRCKKKSAFYNCFVLILRIKDECVNKFKEFHVKIFNTGKLEIPGIQNDIMFNKVLNFIKEILQLHLSDNLEYKENSCETVLVNSNFNCGFYINREEFNDILKYKYNIQSIYDPCSYPGIQCKFYYNTEAKDQTGCQISDDHKEQLENIKKISFMVFRTGSILIVGKCDESVLLSIYEYLKVVLKTEYKNICQQNINFAEMTEKNLKNKDKN